MNANGNQFDADYDGGVALDAESKALELQAQGIESLANNPRFKRQNLDAVGMTKEWDDNRRKNEEEIRRKFYSGDDEGFERYLQSKIDIDAKTRDSIWRYEQAQVKHGIRASREALSKSRNDQYGEAVLTGISAHHYEIAEELDRTGVAFSSQIDGAKKELAELKTRFPNLDTPEAHEELARIHGNIARFETERAGAVAASRVKNNMFFKEQYDGIVRWYADEHKRQYIELREEGYDHETAYMMASDAIGKNSEAMLLRLIDGGQGEGAQFFLDIMRDPESTKSVVVDEKGNPKMAKRVKIGTDGKPVVDEKGATVYEEVEKRDANTYLPQNILFMSRSTLDTLQGRIDKKVKEEAAKSRFLAQQNERTFNLAASDIMVQADILSTEPELKMEKMEELMKKAQALQDAGYDKAHQVSTHLASIVRSAQRKSERVERKAATLQTEQDFEELYKHYEQYEHGEAMFYYLGTTSDGRRNLVKKDAIDGQNVMRMIIANGKARGILKDARWDDRIQRIESARANEDRNAMLKAIGSIGVRFDEEQSRELADAIGGQTAVIAEQNEAANTPFWGEDKSGGLINGVRNGRLTLKNPRMLKFTWTNADGTVVPLTGYQVNQLLEVGAKWQQRHTNPSPSDGSTVELERFLSRVLDNVVTEQKVDILWRNDKEERTDKVFKRNGNFFRPVVGDITAVGLTELSKAFGVNFDRDKVYNSGAYKGVDYDYLRSTTYSAELPSMALVRSLFDKAQQKASK